MTDTPLHIEGMTVALVAITAAAVGIFGAAMVVAAAAKRERSQPVVRVDYERRLRVVSSLIEDQEHRVRTLQGDVTSAVDRLERHQRLGMAPYVAANRSRIDHAEHPTERIVALDGHEATNRLPVQLAERRTRPVQGRNGGEQTEPTTKPQKRRA